jgi:hypothetical protein
MSRGRSESKRFKYGQMPEHPVPALTAQPRFLCGAADSIRNAKKIKERTHLGNAGRLPEAEDLAPAGGRGQVPEAM